MPNSKEIGAKIQKPANNQNPVTSPEELPKLGLAVSPKVIGRFF